MIAQGVVIFIVHLLLPSATAEGFQNYDKESTSSLPVVFCDRITECSELYIKGVDLPRFDYGEMSCDPNSVCGCDPVQLIEHGGICWFRSSSDNGVREKLLKMQVAVFLQTSSILSAPHSAELQCPQMDESDIDVPLARLFSNPDVYVHPSLVLRQKLVTSAINTSLTNSAVFTTSTLAHGEVIMRIPKRALISKDSMNDSPNGRFLLSVQANSAIWFPIFSVLVLFEMGNPDVLLRDVICHLPDSYSHSAYFWPHSALHAHQLKAREHRLNFMFYFYNQIAPSIASRYGKDIPWSLFEFRSFLWAYLSMELNSVNLGGPDMVSVLPALNRFQHSLKPNSKLILESMSSSFYKVVVSKKKGIPAGHELTFSHGALCNEELAYRYGSTLEGNKVECSR
jgi:hypothetical protein